MSSTRPDPAAARAVAPVAALLIVALALRPQLSAVGPLADAIMRDLGVSHAYVGLLTTIPVLCMGVFALVGPSLAHAAGVRPAITLSIAALVAFAVVRVAVPGADAMLLLTFGLGVGTGVVGPVLPMFVRGRLPGRMVAGTAAYAAGTIIGAGIGSAACVPLADATGSWRGSLLVLAVGSLVTLAAWMWLARGLPVVPDAPEDGVLDPVPEVVAAPSRGLRLPQLPLRRPVAWAIGLLFGLQSWLYYGTTAWLANVYVERGWDPLAAAGLLTLVNVASLAAIVVVPWMAGRGSSRRAMLAGSAVLAGVGLAGVTLVPEPAVLWTVLVGAGLGIAFTLVLTLPTDISDDPREVGGAAALMLLVGYLVASIAPFVLGAVRDASGDFEASLRLLVVIAAVMVPFAWSLSPSRLRPSAVRA